MLVYALASAAYAPVMMLADTYALRGLAPRGRAYGPVRVWGSAAFIVASFGAGALLDLMAPVDLIWLMVTAMAIATAAAFALAPLGMEPAGGLPNRASAAHLLRNPAFLLAIAAASLVQASHAVYYGFSTLDWQALGYDGGVIGALWALGVLAEIALFALSVRLPVDHHAARVAAGRCGGCSRALERHGDRAAGDPAACVAMPARILVWHDPSGRARLRVAHGAAWSSSYRTGLFRGCSRRDDGSRHGSCGRAVWAFRKWRLRGDGGAGCGGRALRARR